MFQHILHPTDGSEQCQEALGTAIELAKAFQGRITLIHAYEFLQSIPLYESHYSYVQELENYLHEQSEHILKQATTRLKEAGIDYQVLVLKGDPGEMIVTTAEESKCDLIVMGTRGLGMVKRALLGSVSQYVLHHASCPVLVVRAAEKS